MDQKALDEHNWNKFQMLYPDTRVRAIRLYQDLFRNFGYQMRCDHSTRSIKEQDDLYAKGRTVAGLVVTNARGLQSPHNYGCAIDSVFNGKDPYLDHADKSHSNEAWFRYGRLGEAHGFKWGKNWHDLPHLELTYGLSIEELQDLYKVDGIRSVWTKFDLIRGIPVGSEWKLTIESIQKHINLEE